MKRREIISYAMDLIHGARQYPSGWLKPDVVQGYFTDNEAGRFQNLFFSRIIK